MRYEIVLTAFPFDDFSQTKIRPVLLLTDAIDGYKHIVIAFISSQIEKVGDFYDITLLEAIPQFHMTGLKTSSVIKFHRLLTVPENYILRSLGILPAESRLAVTEKLKLLFSI